MVTPELGRDKICEILRRFDNNELSYQAAKDFIVLLYRQNKCTSEEMEKGLEDLAIPQGAD